MIRIADSGEYLEKLRSLARPGEGNILAFHEHRTGLICRDPRLMLSPLDDHLTHRGDGVFETIKYTEGRLYLLDEHLERMKGSADGIGLTPPCSWEDLRAAVLETAAAGKEKSGMMRILLGRGPGGFGIDPAECPESSLYLAAYRFTPPSPAWYEKGRSGFRTSIPAKQGYLAKLKNANYLPNVMMILEAKEKGMDTPFCFDEQGYLAESSVANLCLVDDAGVLTVPAFTNALPGTTLLRAMDCVKDRLDIVTRKIREEEIYAAKEAILLGTGPDCVAVVSYEGKAIGSGKPGPVSSMLRERIAADILEYGVPVPGLV